MAGDQAPAEAPRNPVITRARDHFAGAEPRDFSIPEWGDSEGVPLRVFVYPITVIEKQTLMNEQRDQGVLIASVNLIIRKAMNEHGKPIFTLEDRRALRQSVSPIVVERIAAGILATEYATAEDLEKK